MTRILITIPAYQAEKTIGDVLDRLSTAFPILVVDDGCTDRSAQIAAEKGAHVITHVANQGKAAALKTGFAYAMREHYDAVITVDADGQHDPMDVPKFIQKFTETGCDMVVGSRMEEHTTIPPYRYWTNRIGSWILSQLIGTRITDTQCGFRLYRVETLKKIELTSAKFAIETELLLKFAELKALITSVPVRTIYHPPDKGTSHFRPIKDTYRICVMVLLHYVKKVTSAFAK